MKKCVVLLSGGLDSSTVLAIAKAEGFLPYALTVRYGQRHAIEMESAKAVASSLGVQEHRFVGIELDQIGGSALTGNIPVPKDSEQSGIPVTYVPARNTVFLSLALGYAEVVGATDIFIGVTAVDYSGYPDCRPEFIQEFTRLAQVATKAGVEGAKWNIHAPLLHKSKIEIIRRGLELNVDYALTHSCYDPDGKGRPCGHCDSCLIRARAFHDLQISDPALV
jgi:7-cyano-7-deazaguanine synthase